MAEAREHEQWSHTASLMALIANANRDPRRTRPFKASDFHPRGKTTQPIRADVSVLKDVFIDGRIPAAAKEAAP